MTNENRESIDTHTTQPEITEQEERELEEAAAREAEETKKALEKLDEDTKRMLTSSAEAARNRRRGDGDEPDPGRDGNHEGEAAV